MKRTHKNLDANRVMMNTPSPPGEIRYPEASAKGDVAAVNVAPAADDALEAGDVQIAKRSKTNTVKFPVTINYCATILGKIHSANEALANDAIERIKTVLLKVWKEDKIDLKELYKTYFENINWSKYGNVRAISGKTKLFCLLRSESNFRFSHSRFL